MARGQDAKRPLTEVETEAAQLYCEGKTVCAALVK